VFRRVRNKNKQQSRVSVCMSADGGRIPSAGACAGAGTLRQKRQRRTHFGFNSTHGRHASSWCIVLKKKKRWLFNFHESQHVRDAPVLTPITFGGGGEGPLRANAMLHPKTGLVVLSCKCRASNPEPYKSCRLPCWECLQAPVPLTQIEKNAPMTTPVVFAFNTCS
jgi:hypothetical protein